MEVALLEKTSLKIKSKNANFVVDPFSQLPKTSTDAVIVLEGEADLSKVTDYRVVIKSSGEYEVGGIKISGINLENAVVYDLTIDNMSVLLAKTSSMAKVSDKIREYEVAIFNVDSEINQTVVTALEPRVVILYGEKALEAAKTLGKEEAGASQKYAVTQDKLPEEMQVVVLK